MSKQYDVDDILNEIKAKKARQNASQPARTGRTSPGTRPKPVSENIEDLSFETYRQPQPEPVTQQKAPAQQPQAAQAASSEPREPQSAARTAVKPPHATEHDDMSNTGVFFSSLSNHRESVKVQQEHLEELRQQEELRRQEELRQQEELRRQEELRQQEELRRQEELFHQQKSQRQPEPPQQPAGDDLTSSFFLEQQPADLPLQQGSTPFGDFEPTTPPPEQPDPVLKGKTEYQKFFSGFGRKKKPEPKQPDDFEPDAPLQDENDNPGPAQQADTDDLFASTPTGLTEEFGAASFAAAQTAPKPAKAEVPHTAGHFHVEMPDDFDQPSEQTQAPQAEDAGLFHKTAGKKQKPEKSSRLASAEIPVPEEFSEEDTELEDYSSPKDKEAILRDMRSIKTGLLVRILLMVVVFGLSLYLALAARDIQIAGELLPLPTFIQPELHLRSYMVTLCVVSAIGAVICSNTIGGGLLALLKFHANTDTLPMLALLGTLAQGICYIIKPEYFSVDKADFGTNLYLFFPVALFILLFNLIGKVLVILRIQNNFKLVSSEKLKHAAVFLKDRNLLREISRGLSMEEYTIAYPETSPFLSNFLDNSYSEDHAEHMSRILAPVCLLAGIILSVLSYLFNKDVAEAVSTFTAIMCVSAPLTSTIAANLPLYRMSAKLIPAGAMVSGYSAVDAFSRTEAVVLDAKDLFRPSDIILHGIKPFDKSQIDSVILDAASVVCNTDGMLTDVFNKIIGSNRSMLRPVENVTYEDSMGLSAWVDGKRVLIGNRELMVNHGIEVPSNDYETRFVRDRKNIIYLANSGQLSAMFVISYRPNDPTREQLEMLADRGMYLIINTSDPNITAEKIHAVYDFPLELIKLMPAKFHAPYEQLTAQKDSSPAKIGFIGSSRMMVTAILDCFTAKTAIDQAVLIQMIALVAGYALVALFSLMGNLSYLSILHLLIFQLVWAIIGTVIPNLKKY
ncbi:MAG: hypothetical protein UEP78_07720 [Negativibacillus sp.]|nr:hypothetical protein [Negativibacillus sp.]